MEINGTGELVGIAEANNTFCRRLGYSRAEMLRQKPVLLLEAAGIGGWPELLGRLRVAGKMTFGVDINRKNRRRIPVNSRARCTEWPGRREVIQACRDRTARKKQAGICQAVSDDFRMYCEASQTPTYVVDVEEDGTLRRRWGNAAGAMMNGFDNAAVAGKKLTEFMGEELGRAVGENMRRCAESGKPLHYVVERHYPAGRRILEVMMTPISRGGRVRRIVCTTHDITGLKEMERELRESGEKYRAIFDNAYEPMFMFKFVPEGQPVCFTEVNRAACSILGYSREEMLRMTPWDLNPPEEMERITDIRREFAAQGHAMFEMDMLTKDGRRLPVEYNTYAFELGGEKMVVSIVRNLTERRRSEKDIRHLERRFATVFRSNPCLMHITSFPEQRYIDVNDAWVRCTGYTKEEAIGLTPMELGIPVSPESYRGYWQGSLCVGKAGNMEIKYRTKSGEIRSGILSQVIIEVNREECCLSVIVDTTELQQYQQETERLDRLNLVGQMAAAIGHEVRNPLTTTRGFLQLLSAEAGLAEYLNHFELMIEELDHANMIISDFLSLARDRSTETEPLRLDVLLRKLQPLLLADAVQCNHEVEMELGEVAMIGASEREINQMVLNLVRNGMESMPGGGRIKVSLHMDKSDVVLAVRDEGTGIPPEAQEKIGRPFFTTKERGTGLGLATCYSIAGRYGAKIDYETGAGGTTFFVRFATGGASQPN